MTVPPTTQSTRLPQLPLYTHRISPEILTLYPTIGISEDSATNLTTVTLDSAVPQVQALRPETSSAQKSFTLRDPGHRRPQRNNATIGVTVSAVDASASRRLPTQTIPSPLSLWQMPPSRSPKKCRLTAEIQQHHDERQTRRYPHLPDHGDQ